MTAMANVGISRIVPKNLLASAMRAIREESEDGGAITVTNVRDLATLVNVAVLYDEMETIASKEEFDSSYKPYLAEGYDAIQDVGLKVRAGPEKAEFDRVLSAGAAFATEPISAAGSDVSLQQLRQRLSNSLRGALSTGPDYWSDFEEGRDLFLNRNFDPDGPENGAENFWLRSFLYLGFAKVREVPFVTDAVRSWGLDAQGPRSDYAQQLETIIDAKYSPEQVSKLIPDTPLPLPPLAAAVFLRAGTRRNILPELKVLREELAPVRMALAGFQHKKHGGEFLGYINIFGGYYSSATQRKADENVHAAFEALRKLKVPLPPQLLVVKSAFAVSKSVASLLSNLLSAIPRPIKAGAEIYEAVSQMKDLSTWSESNPFAEVHHRLGWTLRSWFNEGIKLETLFGSIRDDEPRQNRHPA